MRHMQKEGVPVVILDGEVYNLHPYASEEELEKLATEHAEELFGKDIHFFDVKRKIISRSGIGSKPDGYLVDLSSDEFFVVEIELSSHDVVSHVMNQLHRFKLAMQNSATRNDLAMFLAGEAKRGSKESDANYLARIIEGGVGIFVVIDEVSDKLMEVVEEVGRDGTDVRAIPFETYTNSRNQFVHKFTKFTKEALEKESKKWTFKWTTVPIAKHLEKSDQAVKDALEKLSKEICSLPNAKQVTRKGWTTFQTSPLRNFCAVKIFKDRLEVSLKVDQETFKDSRGIARDLERTPAWTFDRIFPIRTPGETEYAMSLIRQAYECVCAERQ